MEKPKGTEALKILPFTSVALNPNSALRVLTTRTRKAFVDNSNRLITALVPGQPHYAEIKANMENKRDNIDKFLAPGGTSFSSRELLNSIYRKRGKKTFFQINRFLMEEVFPGFYPPSKDRNVGVTSLGYLLDLLKIVNPQVANFDDGVQVMIEAMRAGNYQLNPFLLGAFVDDSLHLRGATNLPFEVLIDLDEVNAFKDGYFKHANVKEKDLFQKGLDLTLGDAQFGATGFSGS